eukprot:4815505-Pleurochrysis_carterae.AAC.2
MIDRVFCMQNASASATRDARRWLKDSKSTTLFPASVYDVRTAAQRPHAVTELLTLRLACTASNSTLAGCAH